MTVAIASMLTQDLETLQRDGIVASQSAFSREFIDELREDMEAAFRDAIKREHGAVGRGPQRWYVEVHPEDLRGFEHIATHPWITGLSEAALGPGYRFVEVGFDIPFQGARNQPWHRDFASPPETYRGHRLTSLAFNLTGVDVTPDMGPFEIAVGTQFDDGRSWKHEMFPPREDWPRFAAVGARKFPARGDVSCRTALTVHRGTEHASATPRPVMILGVVAGDVANPDEHDLELTRSFYERLGPALQEHLLCRMVDELHPITQRHDIEGLVMGAEDDGPSMAGPQ